MNVTIRVSPGQWAVALGAAELAVVAASIGASLLSFVTLQDPVLDQIRESFIRLTWVDGEGNIPAWFSASLLLCCAFLLGCIASLHRQQGGLVAFWGMLSCIFVLLSLDEVAQLHELSIRPLREQFHTTGFLYYPWILPAGLCVATLAVGYSRFQATLPGRTRWLFLVAGTLYVGGALAMEAVSGQHASLFGEQNPGYHVIVTLEELLEMTGAVVFIYALLDYMAGRFTRLTIHFRSS